MCVYKIAFTNFWLALPWHMTDAPPQVLVHILLTELLVFSLAHVTDPLEPMLNWDLGSLLLVNL